MYMRSHNKATVDPRGALEKEQPFRDVPNRVRWPSLYTPVSTTNWMQAASQKGHRLGKVPFFNQETCLEGTGHGGLSAGRSLSSRRKLSFSLQEGFGQKGSVRLGLNKTSPLFIYLYCSFQMNFKIGLIKFLFNACLKDIWDCIK